MNKPAKPTPDFPLFPHSRKQWAKKIKGKMHYFGPWHDPAAALAAYQRLIDPPAPVQVQPAPTLPKRNKAAKPHRDFPLYQHSNGQWAKRIKGTLHYFGTDPDAALVQYIDQKDDLLAGRQPVAKREGQVSIDELVNRYLGFKKKLLESGELAPRTYAQYETNGQLLIAVFGRNRAVETLTPGDFEDLRQKIAETNGHVAVFNWINRIRMIFKYGKDTLGLPPTQYGQSFEKPSRKVLRKARKEKGKRLYTAEQIRKLIDVGDVQLRAMILLGINCGFGNEDCSTLKCEHLDLARGYHTYWRPKTGVDRGSPLWPETVEALRDVLKRKRRPARLEEDGDLVFLTRCGNSWSKGISPITHEFNRLLKRIDIKRKGFSFYCLRHTFETVGGKARDQMAVDFIMGHTPHSDDMRAVYNEEMDDDRLRLVTSYVRTWLYGDLIAGGGKPRLAVHIPAADDVESADETNETESDAA